MKKLTWILIGLLAYSIGFTQTIDQIASRPPNPPRLVNDFAQVMTPDQISSLERKLVDYDDSTSTQIAVVTVKTVGDIPIEDAALKILRGWRVGNKRTNNGIVILAAIQDRRVFIATGYGMEGVVPDIIAKQIIDNEITPNFRDGNFYRGFAQGADAIIKAAAGEYKAPEGYNRRGQHGPSSGNILGVIIFFVVILILIGRSGGGKGGGMMSRTGFLPWMMMGMMMGRGRGGFGGGGYGGGGFGGGGFGGFGGGSGGGGGAGGSW
ncbi:MAG: methanol dehydrogenase [Bacteroidetes bacterium]|nr:MAG: methanol dehydrogenase [Bacteroidota bacterium]